MTSAKRRIICVCPLLLGAAVAMLGHPTRGSEGGTDWLTGAPLRQRLAAPVGVDWSGARLRPSLMGLARAQQVAVYLDRRIDPDQRLDAALRDVPLEEVFRQVAESRAMGVTQLGPVVYFGPQEFTSRLRTLAALRLAEVRQLPHEAGRKFVRSERLQWPELAEPREILSELGRQNGLRIEGLEPQVPHDLWPAVDLPPLSLIDRLTLILGQFDRTFRFASEGTAIAVVGIPENVTLVRPYPAGRQAEETIRQWTALAPTSRIRRLGNQIVVEGLLEDHERIAAPERPQPRAASKSPAPGEDSKRFTVRQARGPWEAILRQLGERLGLTVKIDRQRLERAGIALDQQVAFSVEDATLDQLLEAVLRPAGCTFERRGNVVEVTPAK